MKSLFRASVFLGLYLLLSACHETTPVTPATVTAFPSRTAITMTPLPSQTATATRQPTSTPKFKMPTLIPTIEATRLPELLSKALSIQTIEGVNGHTIQQITGWKYGFGGGVMSYWGDGCNGYSWLDGSHLLLYPTNGQIWEQFEGGDRVVRIARQPVVINLKNQDLWLPPINVFSTRNCRRVYWSQELQVLITYDYMKALPHLLHYLWKR